ncbi:MAG TPA: ferrochelatase [Vicinamibacterales bacterium]|nr:ferrochelatase [Vicinamibacterales bacterium]
MMSNHPFDAVLVIAFGGPNGPDDVRPFLANVLRGRRVSPQRVEDVVHHYELFGGVSPLADITLKQARGLEQRLASAGRALPVYVGMRNWHPLMADTIRAMAADGVRRAVGLILAPHRSFSSCTQYRQNVIEARAESAGAVPVTYVRDWHQHAKFIEANASHVRAALARLPIDAPTRVRLVFTAHSIPVSMAGADRYAQQVSESARLVAEAVGSHDWTVVFQSRSGRPDDPWLGPDVCEYLRGVGRPAVAQDFSPARPAGVVLVPIGFVCDHIEVLYDLDHEAADVCRELGVPMARAETVNDDPQFLDMAAEVVIDVIETYRTGRPLSIVP